MRILWLALLPVIWFYFFFPPADLSFSPGRRTSQSVSIHFLWDLGGVAAFQCLPPSLRSRAERWGGTGEGSVVLTSHEINLGAGKQLPTDFLSMSGLRFGICCASELQRKQHLLCCLSLPVCRVQECAWPWELLSFGLWGCARKVSPSGRWAGSCVSELGNVS